MSADLIDAAKRLMERGAPWLAISPPRYDERPICFGCGVEAVLVTEGIIGFEHEETCAAFDLATALLDIEETEATE